MVRSSKGYAPNTKPWKKAIPEFQTITPNHEVASGWSGWRLLPSLHLVRSFDSGFICDSAPRNTNRWFHWICGPTPSRYPSWNVSGMVKKGQTGAGEFSGQIRWKRRKWVLTWKDLCLICISMLDLDKFPLCISIYLCLSFLWLHAYITWSLVYTSAALLLPISLTRGHKNLKQDRL